MNCLSCAQTFSRSLPSPPALSSQLVHRWRALCLLQITGAKGAKALVVWPSEVTAWAGSSYEKQLFTGGLPCEHGFRHCDRSTSDTQRPSDSWLWNEIADGVLEPTDREPAKFSISPLGGGIYGIGLTPQRSDQHETNEFQARVSAQVHKCSPGYVPVASQARESGEAGVVQWSSAGQDRYSRCEKPVLLTLNQPTKVCSMHAYTRAACQGCTIQ